MEKSAFKTILAHGPVHAGVKENGLGEKSAKEKLLNSVTTQGVVLGRARGGSAVAVLAEPITNPGDGIGWAETAPAASTRPAAMNIFAEENKMVRRAGAAGMCMTTSINEGQILISKGEMGQTQGGSFRELLRIIAQFFHSSSAKRPSRSSRPH